MPNSHTPASLDAANAKAEIILQQKIPRVQAYFLDKGKEEKVITTLDQVLPLINFFKTQPLNDYIKNISELDSIMDLMIQENSYADSLKRLQELMQNVMHIKIESVLQRGQELDAMMERSNDLGQTAKKFYAKVKGRQLIDKPERQQELISQINKETNTVEERNRLFPSTEKANAPYNCHKNPWRDWVFRIHNTKSWRATASTIRESAFKKLEQEVDSLRGSYQEQIDLLEAAKKLPIFNTHRNNSILFGAFWRTATVTKIDDKIEELRYFKMREDPALR